jgi:hypothetical protein
MGILQDFPSPGFLAVSALALLAGCCGDKLCDFWLRYVWF